MCREALLFLVNPCPQVVHMQVCLSVFISLIMLITYSSLVPECSGMQHYAAGQLLIDRHTKIVINPTTQKPSYYRIIKKKGV